MLVVTCIQVYLPSFQNCSCVEDMIKHYGINCAVGRTENYLIIVKHGIEAWFDFNGNLYPIILRYHEACLRTTRVLTICIQSESNF